MRRPSEEILHLASSPPCQDMIQWKNDKFCTHEQEIFQWEPSHDIEAYLQNHSAY